MTLHQGFAFAIVCGMLVLFASDRLRFDLVGGLALTVAIVTGVVPAHKAFTGFSNPVIIIIASVLVIGQAISTSGVIETVLRSSLTRLKTMSLQIATLCACVGFLSAFMKNVGTLGIFMPIAVRTAERQERRASFYLMPLAFASLIGGTITQIGTSPNLLISVVRQEQGLPSFSLFDFTPVGLPLTVLAIAFLAVGWRLIPRRSPAASPGKRLDIEDYISEVCLPEDSPLVGKKVADLEALVDGDATVIEIIRHDSQRYTPGLHWTLLKGDLLLVQADSGTLERLVNQGSVELAGAGRLPSSRKGEEALETIEAVVTAESPLIDATPGSLRLRQRFGLNVLALSRGGDRVATRLRQTRMRAGDLMVVQAHASVLPHVLPQLGLLPMSAQGLDMGGKRSGWAAVIILALAMVAVALGVVPAEAAFFIAAVLVMLLKLVSLQEAYEAVDWPIIVMLGCLIPVGEALKDTGAAGLIGDWLTLLAAHLPGSLAVGLVLVASMIITPFLHHAAAVLVMGPVAATVAHNLGLQVDPFLMAVALGASCDFLTPIGHQNNLLVMGPGGYRFSDYWHLGLPLSILVAVVGTFLITAFWPLH